jgi:Zn ribbon nucleic-acid-binding protein
VCEIVESDRKGRSAMKPTYIKWDDVEEVLKEHCQCPPAYWIECPFCEARHALKQRRVEVETPDYAARFTVEYVCSRCEATGVKLWRKANGADDVLFCAECGKADQKLTGEVDDDGRHDGRYGKTDQLGDLLPAVPIDDTFWGYTSVPDDGVAWWRALPVGDQ